MEFSSATGMLLTSAHDLFWKVLSSKNLLPSRRATVSMRYTWPLPAVYTLIEESMRILLAK